MPFFAALAKARAMTGKGGKKPAPASPTSTPAPVEQDWRTRWSGRIERIKVGQRNPGNY